MHVAATSQAIRILCVDDNLDVCAALRARVMNDPRLAWAGHLDHADEMLDVARDVRADIVILDLDMPGRSIFEVLREANEKAPLLRPIVFSGHCRRDVVERAIECGAWGFVAKHDGEVPLMQAIFRVAAGEVALSREASDVLASPP